MSQEIGIPLNVQFYRELAVLAWQSLDESQREELRRYLILRFIDSGSSVLDGSAASRIRKRFEILLDEGTFDERIDTILCNDEMLLAEKDLAKRMKSVQDSLIDSVASRVRIMLDAKWREWLNCPDGYQQRVGEVVDTVLNSEEIDKVIYGALRRQVSREDFRTLAVQQVDKAVKKHVEASSSRD